MKTIRFIGVILLACFLAIPAMASHIVGGEVTYSCLGNGRYEVSLDIYQDCLNGEILAIRDDTPAFIGIFDLSSGSEQVIRINPSHSMIVPANFSNDCVDNPPPTCLNRLRFRFITDLPLQAGGHRIVYSRCCRNGSTTNIQRPDETGATFFVDIPGSGIASCNQGAVFNEYPPQIICVNNPLVYDHSATDPDGDSLSYEFCSAYIGGSLSDPKPIPQAGVPPFVRYITGYSAQRPMGGNPSIRIDPQTGIITGTPNIQGRYVVNVCCHEWRNGVKINTIRREFQFVVTNCSKAVVANIPQYSEEFNTYVVECSGHTVHFDNTSVGGHDYTWYFGVPGATSKEFQPSYTYPDTGTYSVKLVVNEGTTCPDSITRLVKIYPEFRADFRYEGTLCPQTPIEFLDQSEATFKPVNQWYWSFGDDGLSTEQNPRHVFAVGGTYEILLAAGTEKGCRDTVSKWVEIDDFRPFAGNDTIIVLGEKIEFQARGGTYYQWEPSDFLNQDNIPDPVGHYTELGTFDYAVRIRTENGCEATDSIRVQVARDPSLFVPSAFTPNGDGINDYLRPLAVGYSRIRFFRVYNRYGEEVYYSTEFRDRGWDGTLRGEKAELGTYYWVLGVINRHGEEELIKGDVVLIR